MNIKFVRCCDRIGDGGEYTGKILFMNEGNLKDTEDCILLNLGDDELNEGQCYKAISDGSIWIVVD